MAKTKFRIAFKKEKWYAKRAVTEVHGDSYFVSDRDSTGYSRFVIVEYGEDKGKHHKFVANAHTILYVLLKPLDDESKG